MAEKKKKLTHKYFSMMHTRPSADAVSFRRVRTIASIEIMKKNKNKKEREVGENDSQKEGE